MNISAYNLRFEIDFPTMSLSAREDIIIEDAEYDKILLDSFALQIRKVSIDGKEAKFTMDEKVSKLTIEGLSKDSMKISIEFDGKASQGALHGLYKSSYGTGYLLTTDLEPIGARRLFPCIDNPSFKAVFNLEVITGSELKVLSNTQLRRKEEIGGGRARFIFEPTPKMSTYLFYLGVGKFDETSIKDGSVEYIAATSPGQSHRGKYGLENAVKFLRAYEDYFSIKYPLSKLHLIAIPEYPSGAMENWGAITFREVAFLVDENSSVSNRRRATEVIGHEIAHMWFGDLVTMKWWNDLWLNESFATFMESMMTDKLYPTWNIWSDFLLQLTADALNGDSLSNTHPIEANVKSPDEVSQIFDEISYGKGGSTLRMIEAYVGPDAFRIGVSRYLKKFSYGNAEGSNLWKSIREASNQPVDEMMEAWVKKPGYPLVEVSKSQDGLTLTQRRFFLSGELSRDDPWPIPLTALINGEVKRMAFIGNTSSMEVGSVINSLKLNAGQTGFYRVLYDQDLYEMIEKQFGSLSSLDKWGIISDLFAFLTAGIVSPEVYFRFVEKCYTATEYIVVDSVTDQLKLLKLIAPDNPLVSKAFLTHHNNQVARLGLEMKKDEADTDRILRGKLALNLALCDEKFAESLSARFNEYPSIDPNIRGAVAVAYARSKIGYDNIVSMIKKMGNEADTIKLFGALVAFKDPDLVRKSLDLSMSGEFNRADAVYAIISSSMMPDSGKVVWDWLSQNIDKVKETFAGTYILSSILQDAIPITGLGREEIVKDYFSKKSLEEASNGIRKGLEMLGIYSRLRTRFGKT
ncbi:MAG: M1 family metallopeptidase [Nitrososphaerales archaeon]